MSVIVTGATSGFAQAIAKLNAIELMPVAQAFALDPNSTRPPGTLPRCTG